ncbi:MAG: menaquinone biosynthesis decarboxylase, partial [Deltaproteobacteria bacterium]
PTPLLGGNIAIDATSHFKGEPPRNIDYLQAKTKIPDAASKIKQSCAEILEIHIPFSDTVNVPALLNVKKTETKRGKDIAANLLDAGISTPNIFILFDTEINLTDYSLVAWKLFNNVDPKRDIYKNNRGIVIDATKKGKEDGHLREWPDDIVMEKDIIDKVLARVHELGIEEYL